MPFAVPVVINDTALPAELARAADLARLAFTPVPHSPITSDNNNYRSQLNGPLFSQKQTLFRVGHVQR